MYNLKEKHYVVSTHRSTKVKKGKETHTYTALVVTRRGHILYLGYAKGRSKDEAILLAPKHVQDRIMFNPYKMNFKRSVRGYYKRGRVILKPGAKGSGINAPEPIKSICELVGLKDFVGKNAGSKRPLNVTSATFDALRQIL